METKLSKVRAESLRKYLEDCKRMDFNKAFNLHKERMKNAGARS